jgi:hypothetical protein
MGCKPLPWRLGFPIWLVFFNSGVGLIDKAKVGLRGYLMPWALLRDLEIINEVFWQNLEFVMACHRFQLRDFCDQEQEREKIQSQTHRPLRGVSFGPGMTVRQQLREGGVVMRLNSHGERLAGVENTQLAKKSGLPGVANWVKWC